MGKGGGSGVRSPLGPTGLGAVRAYRGVTWAGQGEGLTDEEGEGGRER